MIKEYLMVSSGPFHRKSPALRRRLAVISMLALFAIGPSSHGLLAQSSVRVWEAPLVIPAYKVGAPELNPMFYNGRAYQGAKGPIYPYPLIDRLSDIREERTYKALSLENEYLKLCVLPEIGGRILSAIDKTDNYDFIYHQHVVKPALIGMLGAWISGGVEWNIPHHHRASTFMTVDHTTTENPDGSKTIWVGEVELRHRMKWIVGLTLFPGRSYVEVTAKLFNRTPFAHSFLYFSNVAVHANADYQVIFPPSTEFATYHGKNQFIRWPIGDGVFGGMNYNGVDLSWWKNHPSSVSFFAWNYQDDFLSGYDHGKEAGVALVADHHIVPGKKFFEWGNGSTGEMWDKILTDADGPYLELMVGGYSDNQPDYSWCQPYEVKTLKQYWYPLRGISGVKRANRDAALNLELTKLNVVRIAFNTTSVRNNARVLLKAKGKIAFEQNIDISPANPFSKDIALPAGIAERDLTLSLVSSDGTELISYTPVERKDLPKPKPVKPPPPPKEIKTIEELYLTGLRLEQFYNPAIEPYPYYEEALRRDPGDYRVNTELGILYLERGMYKEAEEKLRRAVERATRNYTSPKDGEALYYLGVALRGEGNLQDATDAFYKATWSLAWHSPAYYSLAELECQKGDFAEGLELLNRSLSTNTLNTRAQDLKATILRKLGRLDEAEQLASSVLAFDPLDFWAGNELQLAEISGGKRDEGMKNLDELKVKMRGAVQSYLELAVDYADCGLWDDAIDVLSRLTEPRAKPAVTFPMLYYYLGYLAEKKGDREEAEKYFHRARTMPTDYCFPFRLESIDVLRQAEAMSPGDARAPYYLGNLLYDRQPENAIKEWEKSKSLDSSFSIVNRNLGLAYARNKNDLSRAIASLERAVARKPDDPRLYLELDQMYEAGGVPAEKRLALLERNQATVAQYDDPLAREIALLVQLGHYDKAIELLKVHHFHVWEGGGMIHGVYVNAHLLRGEERFRAKHYEEALEDFEAALQYPQNLEVGQPFRDARALEIYYFIGVVHEALGHAERASRFYEKSAVELYSRSEIGYYQGLALRKLGRKAEANQLFESLISFGTERLAASPGLDFFAKFGEKQSERTRLAEAHYLIGLGNLGKGEKEEAKKEFEQTLMLNPSHNWAKMHMSELQR
jgi:tetratricopeptide (TPR) repeat protein